MNSGLRKTSEMESYWRDRAASLADRDIHTDLWLELSEALLCVEEGETEAVQEWSEQKAAKILASYRKLEQMAHLTAGEEINEEAALSRQLLLEGLEYWLQALKALEESKPSHLVCALAEEGQRLLIIVQKIKLATEISGTNFETWGH